MIHIQVSWDIARLKCQLAAHNGDLASIHSSAESSFLSELAGPLTGTEVTWIGGSDKETEGTFVWSDGTPWDTDLWADGEPNNAENPINGDEDCAGIGGGGGWNDSPCDKGFHFVCKTLK